MTLANPSASSEQSKQETESASISSSVSTAQPNLQKTLSIGAGPRKFAAASQALKECRKAERPALHRRITAIKTREGATVVDCPTADIGPQSSVSATRTSLHHTSRDLDPLKRPGDAANVAARTASSILANNKVSRSKPCVAAGPTAAVANVESLSHAASGDPQPFESVAAMLVARKEDLDNLHTESSTVPIKMQSKQTSPPTAGKPGVSCPAETLELHRSIHISDFKKEARQDRNSRKVPQFAASAHDDTASFVLVAEYLVRILKVCTRIDRFSAILPALNLLLANDISVEERQRALRDLLPGIGQVLLLFTFIAVVWKIVISLKEVIDIALWPLTVLRVFLRIVTRT